MGLLCVVVLVMEEWCLSQSGVYVPFSSTLIIVTTAIALLRKWTAYRQIPKIIEDIDEDLALSLPKRA